MKQRARNPKPTPPPIAVGPEQAAQMLSVSRDHLERFIARDLRWIRCGRRKLVLVSDLHAWAEGNAARTLEDGCPSAPPSAGG
jgi:excisionase family DNA binding protein